ncbi:glycosyltransferase family 9 protein [Halosquirtibacter xylanolyticus]|uniref:glycosyltransferase family 9 protein n=1 Tax=Halosquirtibacter xylanolyticus TaxID=3374599 RepID=UPI0037488D6E|nr:glycosyltransferase family 9 protein [Prolixibacteraceae bacterium]
MKNILLFRMSAMGDVALTVPVIRAAAEANPESKFTLVTRPFFAPFFEGIENLELVFPDLKGKHKGFLGLIKFYFELQVQKKWDVILDLHDVLRTRVWRSLFRFAGKPVYVIDKGRKEKKDILLRKSDTPLKHVTERYLDVFRKAKIETAPLKIASIIPSSNVKEKARRQLAELCLKGSKSIGIAPFAMHAPKMWGLDNCHKLMDLIQEKYNVTFFLFGGGSEEVEKLSRLEDKKRGRFSMAGKIPFQDEIAFISCLDLMIAMDSSNMHLGALTGTKTVSIWGGTDPVFGFSAFGQPKEYSIHIPEGKLACRPCSVYGGKPCSQEEILCMKYVTPSLVLNVLEEQGVLL